MSRPHRDAARIADYIEKTLAAAPPLTDDQRTRLAELLRPARVPRAADRAEVLASGASVTVDVVVDAGVVDANMETAR